ncbi:IclR family transcriptional regulator [Piscinibacter sp.]|uniref:IclR family transcriptional regulator n=1 Tax=Piscinibacter sp. TaxID=1903157 RepID=UPI0039E3F6D1
MAILNLFSGEHTLISVDEIAPALSMSAASAYRYASELTEAGLLARSTGRFRLGPKIIELEYLIRCYDPIISVAQDLMTGLSELTGSDVLLCNFYENTIVNVSHVRGPTLLDITYTKGLPMPLFRGSQAHVLLAHLDRRKLRRLFDAGMADPATAADVRAIGAEWPAFLATLKRIREQGHYISRGELDTRICGIAAPVFGENGDIVSSIVVASDMHSPPRMSEHSMVQMLTHTARELSQRLQQPRPAPARSRSASA